jgi:hypothetical protein
MTGPALPFPRALPACPFRIFEEPKNELVVPGRASDHISIACDSNALQDMVNALGPATAGFQPSCAAVGPIFGNV